MRTLLARCTVVAALACTRGALAAAPPDDRTGESDTGFLEVASDPPARIIVDDTDTKTVTPQGHVELKVGHHKLTLVTVDGARKRTIGFNIEAGQTTKLTIHLSS
jgi:hypothetical protein